MFWCLCVELYLFFAVFGDAGDDFGAATACATAGRSAGLVIGIWMVGAGVVDAGSVYFSSNWAGDGCCVGRGRLNGE